MLITPGRVIKFYLLIACLIIMEFRVSANAAIHVLGFALGKMDD